MPLRKLPIPRGLARLVFLTYIVLLMKVVLFKNPSARIMVQSMSIERVQFRLWYASNFTPFKTIIFYLSGAQSYRTALWNLVGNIAIFGPMGFLLPILFPKLQSMRLVAGTSFMVSLSLEIVQLLSGLGSFDIDDVILNVSGATLGWLVYKGVVTVWNRSRCDPGQPDHA